jgi:hypothetical protein
VVSIVSQTVETTSQTQTKENPMRLKTVLTAGFMGFALMIVSQTIAVAGISIAPAYVEIDLEERRPSGKFVVTNTGDETERYRITASHIVHSKTGAIRKVKPDKNSLAPWIRFNPKEFTLPPKSRRAIRFVVLPKGKVESGKLYWCYMELMSLNMKTAKQSDGAGFSMEVKVIPAILVPLFAQKGTVANSASVEDLQVIQQPENMQIQVLLKNTGSGRMVLNGSYEVLDTVGAKVSEGAFIRMHLLPGEMFEFKQSIENQLPEGTYTLNVEYTSDTLKQPVKDTLTFKM